jgi:hypothetical protein
MFYPAYMPTCKNFFGVRSFAAQAQNKISIAMQRNFYRDENFAASR